MRARAARRRHLQQRQTVIFGSLIAALLVAGLAGMAMWTGIVPSPINVPIYSGPQPTTPPPQVPPCPPEGAMPVAYGNITANILNGTDTQGLAGLTGATLRGYGIQTGREENGSPYGGVAQLTTGPAGVPSAYTLAALFTDSQIILDAREDATVDILIGSRFESLIALEQVELDPEAPIPVPDNCDVIGADPEEVEE